MAKLIDKIKKEKFEAKYEHIQNDLFGKVEFGHMKYEAASNSHGKNKAEIRCVVQF